MPPIIAFVRASTQTQAKSAIGLARQQSSIEEYASLKGHQILETVREVGSGALPMEMRPELARVISMAKQTGATIVVETMDRLARNAHVYEQIRREAGVQIVVVKAPSDDPDLHLRALARGAEVERDLIVERTAAGRERAKASGARFRSGDPRRGGKARGAQITAAARKVAADLRPTIEGITADLGSLSLHGLAEKLNELGIGAPRGGRWSAKQVSRLLTRLSDLDACPPASPEAPRMTLGARKSHKTEFAVFFW